MGFHHVFSGEAEGPIILSKMPNARMRQEAQPKSQDDMILHQWVCHTSYFSLDFAMLHGSLVHSRECDGPKSSAPQFQTRKAQFHQSTNSINSKLKVSPHQDYAFGIWILKPFEWANFISEKFLKIYLPLSFLEHLIPVPLFTPPPLICLVRQFNHISPRFMTCFPHSVSYFHTFLIISGELSKIDVFFF